MLATGARLRSRPHPGPLTGGGDARQQWGFEENSRKMAHSATALGSQASPRANARYGKRNTPSPPPATRWPTLNMSGSSGANPGPAPLESPARASVAMQRGGTAQTPSRRCREREARSVFRVLKSRAAVPEPAAQLGRSGFEHLSPETSPMDPLPGKRQVACAVHQRHPTGCTSMTRVAIRNRCEGAGHSASSGARDGGSRCAVWTAEEAIAVVAEHSGLLAALLEEKARGGGLHQPGLVPLRMGRQEDLHRRQQILRPLVFHTHLCRARAHALEHPAIPQALLQHQRPETRLASKARFHASSSLVWGKTPVAAIILEHHCVALSPARKPAPLQSSRPGLSTVGAVEPCGAIPAARGSCGKSVENSASGVEKSFAQRC